MKFILYVLSQKNHPVKWKLTIEKTQMNEYDYDTIECYLFKQVVVEI
jgi:hypothetical protein